LLSILGVAGCSLAVPSSDGIERRVAEARGAPFDGRDPSSAWANARLADVRARFSVLGALVPAKTSKVEHAASTELPLLASGLASVTDTESGRAVRFALRDAAPVRGVFADGFAFYRRAWHEADVLQRVTAAGTEDFLVFEEQPAIERITYDVDVSRVDGLRLVDRTLELLDARGAPRLRVAPPFVIDAGGRRHAARLSIGDCRYDTNPVAPWNRPVTAPGADRCTVTVSWGPVRYPALVDPNWVVAGTMAGPRADHTASLLATGKVLVTGGFGGDGPLDTAELFDPATRTFAATGSMSRGYQQHTAAVLGSGDVVVTDGINAELYQPVSGTFRQVGAPALNTSEKTATRLVSGKVLFVSAYNGAAALYDPSTETFSPTGSTITSRSEHTASMLPSGKVLVAGGLGPPKTAMAPSLPVATAELYDPATGAFTATGSMTVPRAEHTASALASGKVLMVGSNTTADLYDPIAGTFSPVGAPTKARTGHTASTLAMGRIVIAGGDVSASLIEVAELYDPVKNTFTVIGSLGTARENHTATTLAGGREVLLTGGWGVTGGASIHTLQATAEVISFGAPGQSCKIVDDCLSGVCEDGVCCGGPCSGTCKTCVAGTGACVNVASADDPNTCSGTSSCSSTGECKSKTGQPCRGGDAACVSGHCADGFCCDAACEGACVSCNLPGKTGACTLATAGEPGSNPTCAPFVCDGKGAACPATCTVDSECAAGNVCQAATHTCGAGGSCEGDHSSTGVTGTVQDCSPYKCAASSGVCRQDCASVDDCVSPSACDPTGHCLLPAAEDASSGCSVSPISQRRTAPLALLVMVGAFALRRRSRLHFDRQAARGVVDGSNGSNQQKHAAS